MPKSLNNSFQNYHGGLAPIFKSNPLLEAYSQKAFDGLKDCEWPDRKIEAWKYTSTNKLKKEIWSLPAPETKGNTELSSKFGKKLMFVNGEVIGDFPAGVVFKPWQDVDIETVTSFHSKAHGESQDSMDKLSQSLGYLGGVLFFTSDYNSPETFYIEHQCGQAGSSQISSLKIIVEPGVDVNLCESFIVADEAFLNRKLKVELGKQARLAYQSLADSSGYCFGRTFFTVAESSSLTTAEFSISGQWTRMETQVITAGEHSDVNLNGFVSVGENNHCDFRTAVNHQFPNGMSRQNYKYLVNDKATGVFNGKIYIEKDAQNIDSAMINRNLLMSKGAQIFTKPELEIFADDVSANHGTTTGQLEETELFYLQSRGIPRDEAIKLLQKGFAGSCIENIKESKAKKIISKIIYGGFNAKA